MNADRLLAHYDRIADAPDAVPRLRRFILDLAVRGKLVEQDPNDEPASELLKRTTKENARGWRRRGDSSKAAPSRADQAREYALSFRRRTGCWDPSVSTLLERPTALPFPQRFTEERDAADPNS